MALNAKFLADFTDIERGAKSAAKELGVFHADTIAAGRALAQLEDAAGSTTPPVNDLKGALGQVDGVLGQMGVNISSEIKALGELGDASGKTFTQIGAVGTAGLAVGAAMGGWQIGRAISEFFGLDEIIGRTTATLLGFGDVSAQVAGMNADKLAEASKRTGVTITDLGIATSILNAGMKDLRGNAELSTAIVAGWQAELTKVGADLPSLTADLASNNFQVKDLAARYHVSVEALQFFARETKALADVEQAAADATSARNARLLKDLDAEMKARAAAKDLAAATTLELTKLEEQYTVTRIERSGTANQIEIANINATFEVLKASLQKRGTFNADVAAQFERDWKQALDGVGVNFQEMNARSRPALQEVADNALQTYRAMLTSGQFFREDLDKQLALWHQLDDAARGYGKTAVSAHDAAAAANKKQNEALAETKRVAEAAAFALRQIAGGSQAITSGNFGSALVGLGLGNSQAAENLAHEGYSFQEIVNILRGGLKGKPTGPRIPGYQFGVSDAPGGWSTVGEGGPETMYVPPGASIFPAGSGAGGGTSVSQVFNFYGSTTELVEKVKQVVMREAMTRRQFGAA